MVQLTIKRFISKPTYWGPSSYDGVPRPRGQVVSTDAGYMVTFNHDHRHLGDGDQGGPWLQELTRSSYSFGHFQNADPTSGYAGPTLPWPANGIDIPSIGETPADSSYWSAGAKAIAATEPTDPIFNASVAVGETLSDGLPKMVGYQTWKDTTFRAKQAGGEYLNYQFGWVPFVSDIRDFAYAVKHSHEIVSNLSEHANQKIRRSLKLTDDITQQTAVTDSFIKTPENWSIGSAKHYSTASLREKMWFSGCFRYYLPMDNSLGSRMKRYKAYAHKLLGVDLTPEVVWNIAPWSWALDWKGDIGTLMHNASALGHNGLVLQYGYVMHSKEASLDIDAGRWGYRSTLVSRKRRVAANPYGFGVSSAGLSAQQTAVLAALGLTRGDARICR